MIEIFIVVVLAIIILLFVTKYKEQHEEQYKEGDYVVWFGGLYKVISVEGEFIIIEDNTPLKMVHLVETTQPRLKKVSKKFAEKYLSLKPNSDGKWELLDK